MKKTVFLLLLSGLFLSIFAKTPYFKHANEREFYKIVKNDTFSSLCKDKAKLKRIDKAYNIKVKAKLLRELFVDYTQNLANSCINLRSFKRVLSKAKYRNRSQDYEFYKTKIDKRKLLREFRSSKNVKDILKRYTPKHPQFFAQIKALKSGKYTKSQRKKIKLNIERLKLLKYQGSNSFIQLNIPSTTFFFYEKAKRVKTFKTVVGEDITQTPILSSKLSYFTINPRWNIPNSIAKKSVIPKALKDKHYLKKKNIVIRKNYDLNSQKIDFKKINWKKYLKSKSNYIPYKFIQLASKKNGMGRLKFLFNNKYAVYMHDTIGTWRFKSKNENLRFVSHGCVRLEHPLGLMKYLTQKYTKYTYKHTRKLYDDFKTTNISLNKKLPLHITYLTSLAKGNRITFYKDRYGYDKIQKLNFKF